MGIDTRDDAAVYRLRDDLAIVQTVDIFPPIVDDPWHFGAIAAANAFSDVYAMGGKPLLAMNVVCFPIDLSMDILGEILQGGAAKAEEAGVLIVGGHTLDDQEPKYGMAVTGTVIPGQHVGNDTAHAGDVLLLTKPLGTGIITTAGKHDAASPTAMAAAIASMTTLNAGAARVARDHGAHAVTDVTGYGLLGHLREMLMASGVSAEVYADEVPTLPEVRSLIVADEVPGGTERNLASLEGDVRWHPAVDMTTQILLADAQTSGGLLIAIPPEDEAALRRALERNGAPAAATVGRIIERVDRLMDIRPTDATSGSDG